MSLNANGEKEALLKRLSAPLFFCSFLFLTGVRIASAQCYTFASGSAASLTVNITYLPAPTPTNVSWIYQYTSGSGVVGTASLAIGQTTYTPASSSPPTFTLTVGDDPSTNFSAFNITLGFESTNNTEAAASVSLEWSGNFFPNGSLPATLPPISGATSSMMNVELTGPTGTPVIQTYTLSSIANCSTGPPSSYLLTTGTLPAGAGFITAAPSSGNGAYSPGTQVTLTATANAGYSFSSWTVDGLASAANPLQLTMNRPHTVSANFTSTPPVTGTALRFVPVTPCRVVDTRNPAGPLGGPSLPAGSRNFPIPSSSCGIPATALAYSMNVTVVPHGTLGYLSIWPAGQPQPVVSTLNSFDGRIKADAAIVPAGLSGAISLYATDPTDVALDINGYFVPAGTAGSFSFYSVTPCRVIDTRNPAGPLGGPFLSAGQPRTMPVLSSTCNIPSTASAYSLNYTVVPRAALVGYLSTWPSGLSMPLVSTLNDFTGTYTANAAIVPAGVNGSVDVFATDNTDLVVDINGYFGPPGAPGALSFYAATPCRVLDTRNPVGPLGGPAIIGTRDFPVSSGACGVPSTALAYSLNATVVPQTTLGFLSLWPWGLPQPLVSTLNAIDGSVTSNAAIVPAVNGTISAFVTDLIELILDINGYFGP